VLIALAIVGIAMTAIIKATSQNIRSTAYLQNKMIAMWVGQQAMNEVRAGIIQVSSSDSRKQTTTMFDQQWEWVATQEETPNQLIKKIMIKVFKDSNPEDEEILPIITLESYTYHEKK
jgi:general secretion pathway protein I